MASARLLTDQALRSIGEKWEVKACTKVRSDVISGPHLRASLTSFCGHRNGSPPAQAPLSKAFSHISPSQHFQPPFLLHFSISGHFHPCRAACLGWPRYCLVFVGFFGSMVQVAQIFEPSTQSIFPYYFQWTILQNIHLSCQSKMPDDPQSLAQHLEQNT